MNRKNFFQIFLIFPSAGGLAGKVLLAFSYTQSTHLHTTLLQFHTPVRRFIIHPFCTDFRSISTLEASDPQESGTVPEFSKMTPSRKQFWVCIPICCHNSIDGVIFETSRTVPDSWRSGASNVKMDLKSVQNGCMMKRRTGVWNCSRVVCKCVDWVYENASKTLPAKPPALGEIEKISKKFSRFISDTFAIIWFQHRDHRTPPLRN